MCTHFAGRQKASDKPHLFCGFKSMAWRCGTKPSVNGYHSNTFLYWKEEEELAIRGI